LGFAVRSPGFNFHRSWVRARGAHRDPDANP